MENTSGIPELILHTKLYIFADKYNIRALKTLAGEKYNAAAKTGWSTEHFANSIKLIDAFTLPCDGAMRDAVIKHSADHADLVFQNARFVEMMGEVVDFSRGLAIELGKRLAQAKPTGLRYRCPICSGRFIICRNGEAVFGPRAVRNCPFCDRSTNNWSKFVCTD